MLQISCGKVKGRRLVVPKGKNVRPTTARVKQSIFDTLGDLEQLKVLDVFAGSGALGIESLSRGASHSTFVENDPSVIELLKKNLEKCKFTSEFSIIPLHYNKAFKQLGKNNRQFDLIFIDPPFKIYDFKQANELADEALPLLKEDGRIVIEHTKPLEFNNILIVNTKKYGSNFVSFIKNNNDG
jgi:16S rRNA (guanine966-N2)-methyltransferase